MARSKDVNVCVKDYVFVHEAEPRGIGMWEFRRADVPAEVGEDCEFHHYGTYGEAVREARKHFAKLGEIDIEVVV